jgi:hypothetical protein
MKFQVSFFLILIQEEWGGNIVGRMGIAQKNFD